MLNALAPSVLWRQSGFFRDEWSDVDDEAAAAQAPAPVVGLGLWRRLRDTDALSGRCVGVRLEAGEPVEELERDLDHIGLVALDFPVFGDGRSFSAARLLRERYRFSGGIRATGDVLLDQIPFMLRCGFDSFAISHEPTRRALAEGRLPEVPIFMQPVGGGGEVAAGGRPWLRRRP